MSLSRSEQNELKERLKSQRRERHIKEPKNRISLDRGVTKLSELTKSDRKYIENLYVDLTKDISDEMRRLSITPQTNTVKLEKFRLTQLQKSVDRELAHIRDETQTRIMSSMTMAAQSVSQSNVDWLSSMGLKFYHTPAAVPADVIANLVSGKVYADNWEFSKRIWGDYRQSKGDLANIIAKGVAAGKSTYDIAVDLQTYVNPKAAKPWDWSKVYPHSKKKIDYNAQRLARTMTAHAYQQSVIETSKANPFVYSVQWRSAMEHNRTCLICEQRNGNIYPLDNVPLDHPNGLCTIFPVIQGSLKDVAGQLADWVNGNADERFDKKMDSYIDFLGFDPQKIRALTLAAGSLSRSVFSVSAGAAGNVRNDINNADLGLTDGGESDIIEESKKKKPITSITNNAIDSIPLIELPEYTQEQCMFFQNKHKELLEYSKGKNANKEVAFVYDNQLSLRTTAIGEDDILYFEGPLNGVNLVVMHNHPRNSSYSLTDITFFINSDNVKTLTIVKNNGKVEFITKLDTYDKERFCLEYNRLFDKIIKKNTDEEKDKFVKKLLEKNKSGVAWSEKKYDTVIS